MTILNRLWEMLHVPLFSNQGANFSTWTIIYIAILFTAVLFISKQIKKIVLRKFVREDQENLGVWEATATIMHYLIVIFASFIIIQSTGIDLSFLSVFGGALGIGLGFGLQNITNNFVSGIIILFERPIKVGDRIAVGEVTGRVSEVSIRATTIITNDNIAIIVPNSEFVSSQVINWSHRDPVVRFRFPFGVDYSSDPEQVKKVLLEVAEEHNGVLKSPPPSVQLVNFGDSSINFELLIWTREYHQRKGVLRSDLNFLVHKKFKDEGIQIPFPQRVVHMRETPSEL